MARQTPLRALIGLALALAGGARAGQLAPQGWRIADLAGQPLAGLTDNRLDTSVTLRRAVPQDPPPGILIDLGRPTVVDRVVLTGPQARLLYWDHPYENRAKPPRGVVVCTVGDRKVAEFALPYDAGDPIDTEIDLRFQPTAGRLVRIELQAKSPPEPAWTVAELELYGFGGPRALVKQDAVVLPNGAAGPLAAAAGDLSYYLGELTGQPVPVVAPEQAGDYPGTLYRLEDLKSLAPSYDELTRNAAAGRLPGGVHVEREGREVVFRAWPYRAVLQSVWEFLERQGVRWLFPDAHGDLVPTGRGVDLDLLPLHQTPAAARIYANFPLAGFLPWPAWVQQPLRQEFLTLWRQRWSDSWGGLQPAWAGAEVGGGRPPARPTGFCPRSSRRSSTAILTISTRWSRPAS